MKGREMERTSGRQKVRLVAGLLLGLVVLQICWDIVTGKGQVLLPVLGLKGVVACVLALSLMQRASWARHVTGIAMASVLPVNLLVAVLHPVYRSSLFSAPGLMNLVGIAFSVWVAWTLLFDREVIEWFHAGDPEES